MALPVYLAMSAAEFGSAEGLPGRSAWMSCHFSSSGTGLSNLPEDLPANSMIILDDSVPVQGHDPKQVAGQLIQLVHDFSAEAVLLDFQRPVNDEAASIVHAISSTLDRPVGISHSYAQGVSGAVFLPPPPLDVPLEKYLTPYKDRDIWLEAALDGTVISVTSEGSHYSPLLHHDTNGPFFEDESLHCLYRISVSDTAANFTLWRTPETLRSLLNQAETFGVCRAIGLYQELGQWF